MFKKWKDLKIGKKFLLGFGMILVLLLIVSTWSFAGISGIVNDARQVITGNVLNSMLADKEVDHLNWVNKVNALLTDDKVTRLNVETDDHKCGFGKWLYGKERKQAEELVPALAPLFKEMEPVHRALHESALSIGEHFRPADVHLPSIFLERLIDHLDWATAIRDAFLKGESQLDIQTDPKLCAFGKWLQSDEAQKAYRNGDDGFKSVWKNMLEKHEKLHESAIALQNALSESPQQAHMLFEQTTLPLLEQTVAALKSLRDQSQQNLLGTQKANEIYAKQTLPCLEKTQELLHRIRDKAKKHIMTDSQMLASAVKTRKVVILFSVIAIVAGTFLAVAMTRGIIGPLKKGIQLTQAVAQGDLTQSIDVDQRDEIGVLAQSMRTMTENLRKMLIDVSAGVETLASSSTELSAISQQMAASSEQSAGKSVAVTNAAQKMSTSMNSVVAAAEQTSQNVGIVASAAEQMSSTINEIAQNTEKGRSISSKAVMQTQNASRKMEQLGQAAQQVSKITEAITEISEQINLLALNATIESARAGEAGKGFAVVANEIKELANQTAAATQQIRQQIEDIQQSTLSTVDEIKAVTAVINEVNDVVSTIASAIEEQSIATREIAGNIAQASNGIAEVTATVTETSAVSIKISTNMTEVSTAAQEINNASSQVQMSAGELSALSEQLKQMVELFSVN